jgi:hypothetical protein
MLSMCEDAIMHISAPDLSIFSVGLCDAEPVQVSEGGLLEEMEDAVRFCTVIMESFKSESKLYPVVIGDKSRSATLLQESSAPLPAVSRKSYMHPKILLLGE